MRLMLAVDVWGLGAIRMGVHGVAFSDGRAPLGDRLLLWLLLPEHFFLK